MTTQLNLVEQLRAIANVATDVDEFTVQTEFGPVYVKYIGGSGSCVSVYVPFDREGASAAVTPTASEGTPYRAGSAPLAAKRPLGITLRNEDSTDREGKQEGVTVEVQTGDPTFDDRVFIDTYAPKDIVLALLANPVVRSTVIELLDLGFNRVEVDDSSYRVIVTASDFTDTTVDQSRAKKTLHAVGKLGKHLPIVQTLPGTPASDPFGTPIIVGAVLFLAILAAGPVAFFGLIPSHCTVPASDGDGVSLACDHGAICCNPMWHGFLLAIPTIFLFIFLINRKVKGTSDAHLSRTALKVMAVVLPPLYGMLFTSFFEWYVYPGR